MSSTSTPTTGRPCSATASRSTTAPWSGGSRRSTPNDPINIQYTSGTTGYPKGATLSHRNILNNGFFTTELINFSHEDRLAIPVPFYHCFGMVMGNLGCMTHGAAMVIPSPGFDPETTLRTIAAERCTGVYGVPTMFIAMQNHPSFADHDLSTLRTGIMAGATCPVEVMKRCVDDMHMAEVSIAYGMTETSPVSCQTRTDDDLDRRTSTIGRVHPHVEIKVVDPATGETLPRGETGEFCTRGYSVMLGYWHDEERTAEAIDADGWMHTGDLAVMRDDGYCNIVGRIKDMVIRGGENIYPREIEEFLYQHPDVEDVQVVGVPDERFGEELCAWVRMRSGREPLTADAVREFAAGRLAHYKIPRYVVVVDEFPMTVTGKIRKVEMREQSMHRLGLALTTTGATREETHMPEIDPQFLALPLRGLADAALSRARSLGVQHADFRLERVRYQHIRVRDGRLEGAGETEDLGIAVRVIHRGAWGFASGVVLDPDEAVRLAEHRGPHRRGRRDDDHHPRRARPRAGARRRPLGLGVRRGPVQRPARGEGGAALRLDRAGWWPTTGSSTPAPACSWCWRTSSTPT